MTAIVTIKQAAAIHVLTDGLAAGAGGYWRLPKAFPVPHVGIVAIRGTAGAAAALVSRIWQGCPDFDHLVVSLPEIARQFATESPGLCRADRRDLRQGFEIVAVGLSPRHGLQTVHMSWHADAGCPWVQPFEVVELPAVVALPGDAGVQEAIEAIVGDVETCDVRAVGHQIIGLQMDALNPQLEAPIIGGHSMLCSLSVTPGGPRITSEILGTWPLPETGEVAEPEIEYAS